MRHLRRLHRGESGFSLIEQLVVITIISIIGLVGFGLLMMPLGAYHQNVNSYYMRQERTDISTYLYEHDYHVSTGNLAPNPADPAVVKSVALSKDQLAWCNHPAGTDTHWCVRLFYVARLRRLFEVRAAEPFYSDIAPVRGPNETVPARADCPAPCYVAAAGSPLQDLVLDRLFGPQSGGSNQLASNVSLGTANVISTSITSGNAPFKYFDALRRPLSFPPPQANSSNANLTSAQRAQIGNIYFDFYLQPPITAPWAMVAPMHYDYWFPVTP
jgi:prepilin-type N-terminal cleavage/methylation domain-containing protein